MADELVLEKFELKAMCVARIRGDEEKSIGGAPSRLCVPTLIKRVEADNKCASRVRRQSSECAQADTTSTINKNTIRPTRRNQSTPKSTHSKIPRQRARRSTAGSSRCRAQIGASSKNQANLQRKLMGPLAGIHDCFGCKMAIKDRYLLGACDKYWHEDCLKCDRCHAKLGELGSTLYERANMNLCRQDYLEMFGQKAICAVCDKLIYASEMVMRARDNVYHLECFACQLCGLRFCIGDQFHLCENKIVCQYDYDEHIWPLQATMFDSANNQQYPTIGQQYPFNLASMHQSQQQSSLTASDHLGDYTTMIASNSRADANESELAQTCAYPQSIMHETNQLMTTHTLEQEIDINNSNSSNTILAMPIGDQDQQTTGEKVELTMLGSCEPLGKSNDNKPEVNRTPID